MVTVISGTWMRLRNARTYGNENDARRNFGGCGFRFIRRFSMAAMTERLANRPPVQQMRGNDSPRPSSSRRCSPRLVSSSTASPRTQPMLAAEGWKRCSTARA